MLGVQWHTKGEEINWLEPKQPRVTRHTHITLIIVQILNLNHHDVKQMQCENKYTYHTKKAKCLHCERRNHHSKLQTNEKSSVLAVRAYNIDGRGRWTFLRLVVTAHEGKSAPQQRWKPRWEQLPVKPRNDSEQRQSRLYTQKGTVAGRAEGNWIFCFYIYIYFLIYFYIFLYKIAINLI